MQIASTSLQTVRRDVHRGRRTKGQDLPESRLSLLQASETCGQHVCGNKTPVGHSACAIESYKETHAKKSQFLFS